MDNEPSIRQIGLFGQVGDFQSSSGYDDETYGQPPTESDEVIFMADKKGLGRAVNAMVHHISKKLGKGFQDVTDDDIRNYGLLCVMHDEIGPQDNMDKFAGERATVSRRPEEDKWGEEYPRGAEPGDYYSDSRMPDQFIKGSALLRLLQRYGEWPRDWGKEGYRSRDKQLRGRLMSAAMREHPEYSKEKIRAKIQSLSGRELERYAKDYLQWQQHR
ncbi:MAG: hypothetical protein M0R80_08855 [Proteobacteria bacterium]|nr:hypothetical protein [Pseudomonadota bacterium]